MSTGHIEWPTLRKVKNRGWRPICYRMSLPIGTRGTPHLDEVRHGWIIKDLPDGGVVVRLVGEEHNRRLPATEWKWIKEISR